MDIAAYCMENPGESNINPKQKFKNCRDANESDTIFSTAGGNVTLNLSTDTVTCSADGYVNDTVTVNATLDTAKGFIAKCFTANQSIRCTVEPQ